MKKTWTDITARDVLKSFLVGEKTILFDGKATLRQCGAADFLVKECGYVVSSEFRKGE